MLKSRLIVLRPVVRAEAVMPMTFVGASFVKWWFAIRV